MSKSLAKVLGGLEELRGLKEVSGDFLRFRIGLAQSQGVVLEKLSSAPPLPSPGGNGSGSALTFEALPLDSDALPIYFASLLDSFNMKEGEGPDLSSLTEESEGDPEFLRVFAQKAGFRPHSNFLTSLARRLEVPAEVLGFIGHTLVSPFAAYAARRINQEAEIVDSPVSSPGECPICGAAPAFAGLSREKDAGRDGARSAYCSLCGHAWSIQRISCMWCGTEDQAHLSMIMIDESAPHWIETCSKCKKYAKTFDERKYPEEVLFQPFVEETASLFLDMIAETEGYSRKYPFTSAI